MIKNLRRLRAFFSTTCFVVLVALGANAYAEDDYNAQWGPALGTDMPPIASFDQEGVQRELADLSGEQGLLLFLNRSADW